MARPAASVDKGYLAQLPDSYSRWRESQLGRITDTLEERLVVELLAPVDGCGVLDVGCGDGALACTLSRNGATVTGLDANAQMLAAAQVRAAAASIGLNLVRGRAELLPFADEAFNRIVAVTVLCLVEQADRAIAEMARVLRPGGRLVIGELGKWSLWAGIRRIRGYFGASTWKAARLRTVGELQCMMERNGLAIRATRGSVYYPPSGLAASLMARVDPWLGRRTTLGAAFLVLSATKPVPSSAASVQLDLEQCGTCGWRS